MSITGDYLTEFGALIAAVLYALVLLAALWRAPWGYFKEERNLHVFLGTCVALSVLWTVRAATIPGLGYHYFGATLLTLMFGWPLAVLANGVVLVVNVLNSAGDWASLPANALVLGVVPIAVSQAILRLSQRSLPRNYFVYVFVGAYFSAAVAFVVSSLATSAVLLFSTAFTIERLSAQFFPLVLLMAFPEAFITGLLMAILTVYKPAWVRTFDDELYLKGK